MAHVSGCAAQGASLFDSKRNPGEAKQEPEFRFLNPVLV
jgi:hypothetical protein